MAHNISLDILAMLGTSGNILGKNLLAFLLSSICSCPVLFFAVSRKVTEFKDQSLMCEKLIQLACLSSHSEI